MTPAVLRRVLTATLPLGLAVLVVGIWVFGANRNYFAPSGHLIPLIAGCLAAELHYTGLLSWLHRLTRSSYSTVGIGVAIAALVVGYNSISDQRLLVPDSVIAGIGTALVILHVCSGADSLPITLLASRPARWVGRRSCGFYLYFLTTLEVLPALDPSLRLRYYGPLSLALDHRRGRSVIPIC